MVIDGNCFFQNDEICYSNLIRNTSTNSALLFKQSVTIILYTSYFFLSWLDSDYLLPNFIKTFRIKMSYCDPSWIKYRINQQWTFYLSNLYLRFISNTVGKVRTILKLWNIKISGFSFSKLDLSEKAKVLHRCNDQIRLASFIVWSDLN